MEIQNVTQFKDLYLEYAMPFAQLIIHTLTTPVREGEAYSGRYQNAQEVEYTKAEGE
jgi:hypothetical protein